MKQPREAGPLVTITRRSLLGGALALAVSACGGGGTEDASPTATAVSSAATEKPRLMPRPPSDLGAPPVPAATVSTARDAMSLDTSFAPYKAYGTDAAPGVFPRTVRHARGETLLRAQPQRVVALERAAVDILFELGIKPVAIVDGGALGYAPHLKSFLEGVPAVGTAAEPNFETIVNGRPDLILAASGDARRDERLSQIAPTVYRSGSGVVWQHFFALTAQTLGHERKAAEVIQRYEARVQKLNAALPKTRPTFSIVRVFTNNLRYMLRANYAAIILTDLGIPRPAAQNVDDFALINQSLETVGQYADAGVIVVAVDEGDAAANFARQMVASPTWRTLEAVKNDRVIMVDNSTWIGGIGYESAHSVLNDIAKYFKVSA